MIIHNNFFFMKFGVGIFFRIFYAYSTDKKNSKIRSVWRKKTNTH